MPKLRYPLIKFDKLQMLFMKPYVIDVENCEGTITLNQPRIGEIVDFGEDRFFHTLSIFITNTTTYRLMLWEAGVDWNTMSDFELFCTLYKGIDDDACKLIFDNISFSNFEIYSKQLGDSIKVVLYDKENKIEIDEDVYQHMAQYLRTCFLMVPEEKITSDENLKRMYIKKDRSEIENRKFKKEDDDSSSFFNAISACINHPGFKYNLQELKEVGVYQFYDSVKRLQVYEQTTACLKGMYSGFVDGKKLSSDDYNFMKNV